MQPIYSAQLLEGEQFSWSVQAAFIMRTIGLWIAACLAVQLVVTWWSGRLHWICATRNVGECGRIEASAYSDHLPALADIAFSDLPASEPAS